MPIKKITNFGTLLRYAKEEAKARQTYGESSLEFKQAQAKHESYRKLCLKADEMQLGAN